ncbi:MAG: phosphotransferase family protein [Burkholderiales bacterium]|nr:phosphotransferase family protein [Burkholderiales bacterium]
MPVHSESSFDAASLAAYLSSHLPEAQGTPRLARIGGGQSNPSYFVTYPEARLVLRKKPAGVLLPSAHAIDREYRVQSALARTAVPVPRMRLYCNDAQVIGTEFYVMDYVPGRVFGQCWLPEVAKATRRAMYLGMAATLASLHNVDYRAVGLADFGKTGDYYGRQIGRWSKQWELSKAAPNADIDRVVAWLSANAPKDVRTTINHGDFRIGNLMFDEASGKVVAVLDWELATLGDPLADVAYSALGWRLASDEYMGMRDRDLAALGIPSEAEYVAHYERLAPESGKVQRFHFVFALFRIAAIFEGIAGRARGGTQASENAAEVGKLSGRLARRAVEAIER